jgi:hypothetical protein
MQNRRVLASIEQRGDGVLVRVYQDHGEEFELVGWEESTPAEARPRYVRALFDAAAPLLVAGADGIHGK